MQTLPEYTPLDLGALLNTDVNIFEDSTDVILGNRQLYGLPFQFGTPENAALLLHKGGPRVSVEVDGTAHWIIFAHAVLETDLYSGGSIGDTVGHYTIDYADGREHQTTIRQRFEIGPTPRRWTGHAIPLDWGQTPFLAYNDAEHELMDRNCGRYDEAGARFVDIKDPQSRVPYVLPYRFYLWALRNPNPEATIKSISLEAAGQSILVGAITVSSLAEEPFTRSVARDVIFVSDRAPIDDKFSVEVDRGTSTYVYRTTELPESGALPGGWGARKEAIWDRGYAKISAAPSATISVRSGSQLLGSFTWRDALESGEVQIAPTLIAKLAPAAQSWIRTAVRDEATGELLPCRIRFQTPEGIPIAPYGHHAHINSDGGTWNLDIGGDVRLGAYSYGFIDGTCEGWLPTGPVIVEVSRGFEYQPIRTAVTIEPGQSVLELRLERLSSARARGYLSGDTHVHFVSTQGAELEARAEDVDITNLLLTQWGHLFTSTEEFVGRPQYSLDRRNVVFAGQENRTNILGHINLLGLREPIMPWCTGGSEEASLGGGLETTLSHWADECHAQGGTVVLAHFPVPYGETAALLATGRLDAVETIAYDDYNIGEYYRYLNAGYKIPIVAGTDKMTSEVPIGLMRTYAGTGEAQKDEADYWEWCAGIKRGDTMVSSGPLLWLTVNGSPPGTTLTDLSGSVQVDVELDTIFPVDAVEIVIDGTVYHREVISPSVGAHRFTLTVPVNGDSWILARCFGEGEGYLRHNDTWERPIMAHTSPVYFTARDSYDKFDLAVATNMLAIVEGARRYVVERARTQWPAPAHQRHGETDHLAFLTRPFDEATAALTETIATHRRETGQ
jgi:hypothetical protein